MAAIGGNFDSAMGSFALAGMHGNRANEALGQSFLRLRGSWLYLKDSFRQGSLSPMVGFLLKQGIGGFFQNHAGANQQPGFLGWLSRFSNSGFVSAISAVQHGLQGGVGVAMAGLNAMFTVGTTIISGFLSVFTPVALIGGMVGFAMYRAATAVLHWNDAATESIMKTQRMAREMGVTFESMKLIEELATRSGIPGGQIERWLGHMSALLGGVVNGNYEAIRTFRLLGLQGREIANMPVDQAFFRLIGMLQRLPSQYERVRVAHLIFGRDFRRVLDMAMAPGAQNIEGLREHMRQSGLMLDDIDVTRVEQAYLHMRNLRNAVEGLGNTLAISLAPIIQVISDRMRGWVIAEDGEARIRSIRNTAVQLLDTVVAIAAVFANLGSAIQNFGDRWLVTMADIAPSLRTFMSIYRWTPAGRGMELALGDTRVALEGMIAEGVAARQRIAARGAATGEVLWGMWIRTRDEIGNAILAAERFARVQMGIRAMNQNLQSPAGQAGLVGQMLGGNALGPLGQIAQVMGTTIPAAAGAMTELLNRASEMRSMPWLDQFVEQIRDIRTLMWGRFFTGDEGARAQLQRVEELEQRLGTNQYHAPKGYTIDTTETGSLIARLFNTRDQLDPQQRIANLMEAAARRDEERNSIAREIRQALLRVTGVNLGPVN